MRDHVAAASNDMAGAMGAIDAALKATIEAAHARLTESQRDTQTRSLSGSRTLRSVSLVGVWSQAMPPRNRMPRRAPAAMPVSTAEGPGQAVTGMPSSRKPWAWIRFCRLAA